MASAPPPAIPSPDFRLPVALAIAAACAPSLLAYNVSPSPTFLNQALAFLLWGAFIVVATPHAANLRRAAMPLAALAVLAATATWSWIPGGLPASLALSSLGTLAAAALALVAGASARHGDPGGGSEPLFAAFCSAWVFAGVLNALVALIQVFAPDLPDGSFIAISGIAGRAVGNLRQPNHLSSLLLWSCIAVVALVQLRRLSPRWALALLALFVWAVVLTASRTGLLSVLLLGAWGLFDRRLSRPVRGLLLAAPLVYALAWWGMAQWAALSQHTFGGTARLAETDISGSRFGIWANTVRLIQEHRWFGVGWGEFNLAWTMSPFPGRPIAFFDHAHNLPLHLAAEIGAPLAQLVLALLAVAFGRAVWRAWRSEVIGSDAAGAQRAALMMVLMIAWHSTVEYPLWYSYFLLPACWAFGFALRSDAPAEPAAAASTRRPVLAAAGWLLVAGALFSVWDYSRVSAIYQAEPGAPPLAARIQRGQGSVFFAHHADYAAVTSGVKVPGDPAHAFDRTTHYLLDSRLMMAWARSLAAQGDLDGARHIAARLREFRKVDAEAFFEPCPDAAQPPGNGLPFQCELPPPLPWQHFLPKN